VAFDRRPIADEGRGEGQQDQQRAEAIAHEPARGLKAVWFLFGA
jgi:hypothetical protein